MITDKDLYAYELRYRSLREEAAQHRFRHRALGIKSDLPRPCCAVLFWIGCRLAAWGSRLQAQFGDEVGYDRPGGTAHGYG